MEKTTWKTIAIIFMILFILETAYCIWAVSLYYDEIEDTNVCYYEFCREYPQADLTEGICTCYDLDILGKLIPVDWKVM